MVLGSIHGHRDWDSGLLACFTDLKSLLCTWFCTPIAIADISSRLGDSAVISLFLPNSLLALRVRLRTLGGIQGSIGKDWWALGCCCQCAVCQMLRELDAMGL
ncbi:cornifelin-like [Dreissena polymorpha]|uniref:cornifelin-like n=1 Tax=Dreissena polymorpha TaxID=45954 RepID=UPI0022643788|nr:cornifelin-like [Dreissena polymorpha]